MDLSALHLWRSTQPMDTDFTTWLGTCGSGQETGTALTITSSWRSPVGRHAILKDPIPRLILPNQISRRKFSAADRFSALISTVPATSSEHEARARSRRVRII